MKCNFFKLCTMEFHLLLIFILTFFEKSLSLSNKLQNSFLTQSNLNNANSISIKNEKTLIRTSSQAKLKSLFSFGVKSFSEFKNLKVENRFQGYPKATVDLNNTAEIGQGPIYYEGWNKYFILRNTKGFEMKEFFENGAYYKEQSEEFKNKHKEDNEIYIPNANAFYVILTDEYLNVVSSKFVRIID